jgi:hypothetical protein
MNHPKDGTPKRIADQVIEYLSQWEAATIEDLAVWFGYRVYLDTLWNCLQNLERKGKVIYSPKSRLFYLAQQ